MWTDPATGQVFYSVQYQRVPLNPDAFMPICVTEDDLTLDKQKRQIRNPNERTEDQEEVLRAGQSSIENLMANLIRDLNKVDEEPLSSQQFQDLLHERGACVRNLGKICTDAKLNHTRELAVIEILSRCEKLVIRDSLSVLSERSPDEPDDEAAASFSNNFTAASIKKCILNQLHNIFD